MAVKKQSKTRYVLILGLLFCLGLVTACQNDGDESTGPAALETRLLVDAPNGPLPSGRPVTVRSLTRDPQAVSHVELYAVEVPSGEQDVLLRSDAAPFAQTSFTVSQTFTPVEAGYYVIKVIGYNMQGNQAESNFIGFDVE